ncbi:MAG: TOBE domain-containing protein, partial [Candidatus Hydrogenedentales bacterium]
HARALNAHDGKPVTLGIRPESLQENASQSPRPGESVKAVVEVVEPMGAENYLYLRAGETALVARVRPDALPPVGEAHVVDVDTSRLHYFAGDSANAITS